MRIGTAGIDRKVRTGWPFSIHWPLVEPGLLINQVIKRKPARRGAGVTQRGAWRSSRRGGEGREKEQGLTGETSSYWARAPLPARAAGAPGQALVPEGRLAARRGLPSHFQTSAGDTTLCVWRRMWVGSVVAGPNNGDAGWLNGSRLRFPSATRRLIVLSLPQPAFNVLGSDQQRCYPPDSLVHGRPGHIVVFAYLVLGFPIQLPSHQPSEVLLLDS
jgi:hypothetical protein